MKQRIVLMLLASNGVRGDASFYTKHFVDMVERPLRMIHVQRKEAGIANVYLFTDGSLYQERHRLVYPDLSDTDRENHGFKVPAVTVEQLAREHLSDLIENGWIDLSAWSSHSSVNREAILGMAGYLMVSRFDPTGERELITNVIVSPLRERLSLYQVEPHVKFHQAMGPLPYEVYRNGKSAFIDHSNYSRFVTVLGEPIPALAAVA